MTPRTSPTWGTSRRSTSPTSGGSERHRTRGTRRRCWKRCPIWRHRPPLRVLLALGGDQPMPRSAGAAMLRARLRISGWGTSLQMRKEAVPFLESLGIPKPRSKAEWSYIFKEMGTFLAAKNFIVNCPLPVMELPVARQQGGPAFQGGL